MNLPDESYCSTTLPINYVSPQLGVRNRGLSQTSQIVRRPFSVPPAMNVPVLLAVNTVNCSVKGTVEHNVPFALSYTFMTAFSSWAE